MLVNKKGIVIWKTKWSNWLEKYLGKSLNPQKADDERGMTLGVERACVSTPPSLTLLTFVKTRWLYLIIGPRIINVCEVYHPETFFYIFPDMQKAFYHISAFYGF